MSITMTRIEQQRIGTTEADGQPVAYAVSGAGPLLVCVPGWISDVELGWAIRPERAVAEAIGRGRRVIRYDLPGCGRSRPATAAPSIPLAVATLDAVIAAEGAGPVDLYAVSFGVAVALAWAAAHPDRVRSLVLYGGWADGSALAPPELRERIPALVRAHWGLGSDVLADIFASDADATGRASFARYQRAAASAATAADILALSYRVDASADARAVTCPTLVLHRAEDRAVPVAEGRRLARLIPGARFESIPGRSHIPYLGDVTALSTPILRFLGIAGPPAAPPALTPRQLEVAALVADGLTNREIALALTITEKSAESHLEHILTRLGFRSRAQIAAWYASGSRS
ncbi:alpha/beta fold hydrolase [uncultured Leifsonia sp.]|uniref:alpha/beta fold hydrolase n=1 Tax=uncultured Leifsonia sp. TaxID=340359 RepID=UPI0028D85472|nr:alpha/beta fold hydrolase [uncultured Leifsonia sp.]